MVSTNYVLVPSSWQETANSFWNMFVQMVPVLILGAFSIGMVKDMSSTSKGGSMGYKSLREKIKDQILDESSAWVNYLTIAEEARDLGYYDIYQKLNSIADDEARHRHMLNDMLQSIK